MYVYPLPHARSHILIFQIAILHPNPRRSRVRFDYDTTTHAHQLTGSSAEVIKIEHPTKGDDTRHWGPPYAKYKEGSGKEGHGESAYFFAVWRIPPLSRLVANICFLGQSEQEISRAVFSTQIGRQYTT